MWHLHTRSVTHMKGRSWPPLPARGSDAIRNGARLQRWLALLHQHQILCPRNFLNRLRCALIKIACTNLKHIRKATVFQMALMGVMVPDKRAK